jgi:diguanylate cyclase (GGDEF)-like protein/PAS domain S-box-containing protein
VRGEVDRGVTSNPCRLRGTLLEITDRKRSEEQLALSECRYRSLVEAAAIIVWATPSDGLQAGDIPGWRAFTGQTYQEVLGLGWADALHPDDRIHTLSIWRASVKTGETFEITHRLRRHDGVYRTMACRAVPVRNTAGIIVEWVGMHMDITDREIARDLHHRAELASFTTAALTCTPIATIVTDCDGLITAINPAAERLLGCAPAELVGRETPLVLLDDRELAARAAALRAELRESVTPGLAVLTTRPRRGLVEESEWSLRRRDGTRLDVQLTVAALTDSSNAMQGLILTALDITERKRAADRMTYLANHDALTGLPTRRLLDTRLELAVARAEREDTRLAVLVIDLDNLKRINDELGHHLGDSLIAHAAGGLMGALADGEMAARSGGGEFSVLLEDIRNAQHAEQRAEQLLAAIRTPVALDHHTIAPTASIGISVFPEGGDTPEALMRHADGAMHHAKRHGQNCIRLFTGEMAAALFRRRQLLRALPHALARGEFQIVYHPQLSLRTGLVTGVEALIRWRNATLGDVSPSEFIPLAEEAGLIEEIGDWVLRTACRDGRRVQRELGRPLIIGVNGSPRQFQVETFPHCVDRALEESGLAPELLELEITENILLGTSPSVTGVLMAVRARGVRLAIDDFGTGYCSLSYIMRFKADRLKIDQSFIRNITCDAGSRAVTTAIIGLARNLHIDVIAEGIETVAHQAALLALSCHEVQGFLYSRPVPVEQLATTIRYIDESELHLAGAYGEPA